MEDARDGEVNKRGNVGRSGGRIEMKVVEMRLVISMNGSPAIKDGAKEGLAWMEESGWQGW